ncbi:Thrombospondin type 3 repeat-containing protein [Nannocystis exedens]|uniref:Thrombospondin type 3 repeat-containing protein n=1 Tax=Nannocystis exedens TaxID=54 RepID=A0A1I2DWR4_9BACT|nr:thrombospondin type 3 repeat-containing protein [Nannocystis exedens]PCC69121.1 Thrombospondin type 3 repeat protein [Nannocystis exedens]SFE85064.1 Thrombospondin type 3 repeat-containing protein [Nannocystis exedens]
MSLSHHPRLRSLALTGAFLLTACPSDGTTTTDSAPTTSTGGVDSTSGTGGDSTTTVADEPTGTTGEPTSTGEPPTSTTSTTGTTGEDEVIPVPPACEDPGPTCMDPITKCKLDQDRDGFVFECDNAPDLPNPGQEDIDGDGFGDVADLCPVLAKDDNFGDADRDGVGDECDVCSRSPGVYNKQVASVPFYMRARRNPAQADSDRDGVGDSCDNCVRVANCEGYGDGPGLAPHVVGQPTDVQAPGCQDDADVDLIGDACEGMMVPGAAGPVGFLDGDDFDQDGLANLVDGCPRQPVERRACAGDDDCSSGATCSAAQICNHADHDGDAIGDACDNCPWTANPEQLDENVDDDPDLDFIGAACEQQADCVDHDNPRPFAFYDVSVNGYCCVTTYNGQPLVDPDGEPIDVADLPPLPPGVLELPPGCEEALAHSEDGKAHKMKACHVDAPTDLWQYLCLMPAWDHEFDGVPDGCDLCPYAYDPSNAIYVDAEMKEWPNFGKYCQGDYSADNLDPANMCMP